MASHMQDQVVHLFEYLSAVWTLVYLLAVYPPVHGHALLCAVRLPTVRTGKQSLLFPVGLLVDLQSSLGDVAFSAGRAGKQLVFAGRGTTVGQGALL